MLSDLHHYIREIALFQQGRLIDLLKVCTHLSIRCISKCKIILLITSHFKGGKRVNSQMSVFGVKDRKK